MSDERLQRLLALTRAAQNIADSTTRLGVLARHELSESTGLSLEGVDFALRHSLESSVSRSNLSGLVRQTKKVPRSHVLLSANVFTAVFRAIALGLCQSDRVAVRASRREPVMTRLLHEGSDCSFELCEKLSPLPGEHFWAYGTAQTLQSLRASLPLGLHLHSHGPGLGVAVFVESEDAQKLTLAAAVEGLVKDTVAFDQRGCLSPRIVIVEGSQDFAETICDLLVSRLKKWEREVPRGLLSESEEGDLARFFSTMHYVGSSVLAGKGMVFLDPVSDRLLLPPIGRNLQVTVTKDAFSLLLQLGEKITTVGFYNPGLLPGRLQDSLGARRYVELGEMQRPVFDGPVDFRSGFKCETL